MSLSRELKEIEEELQSNSTATKIKAIHKVIGQMNMGKNVSSLYFSVMKCLEIKNEEIKKLVYLYVTQYSQDFPKEAMMSVNSFIRDARDKRNSIVRAMAIRAMGCLRVPDLNDYLMDSLIEALSDDDSYVKKTVVLAILKINEVSQEAVKTSRVIEKLVLILKENNNAYVIANTLVALNEMERQK